MHIYANVFKYVCCFLVLFFPDTRKGKQTNINCDVFKCIFEEMFKKVLEPGQNRNIISLTEMMLYDDEDDDDTMSSF